MNGDFEIVDAIFSAKEKETSKKRAKRRKLLLWIGGSVTLVLVISAGITLYITRPIPIIPKSIQKSAGFPLYYPSPLSNGYTLDKNSIKYSNGIVSYVLLNGSQKIAVTEQTAPQQTLDLKNTPGFYEISNDNGEIVSGLINNNPVVIMTTNTTMLNMSGSDKSQVQAINKLAQNMTTF